MLMITQLKLLFKHRDAFFFSNGVNVEFIEVLSDDRLKMRVWERVLVRPMPVVRELVLLLLLVFICKK